MIADDRPNDDKGDANKEARESGREGDIQIAVMAMGGGVGPQIRRLGFAQHLVGSPESHEAMAEYEKIFPSKVNDYALDQESSEDCANFRFKAAIRISECWEAKKNLSKALEYVLLARDRYKFVSYCKDCLRETRKNVDSRVKRLEEAGKKTE